MHINELTSIGEANNTNIPIAELLWINKLTTAYSIQAQEKLKKFP